MKNPSDNDQFLTLNARIAFETYNNFKDAVNHMSTTSYIGPGYTIMGGVNSGEGVVLTISPHNDTIYDSWPISQGKPDGNPWYVLETSYDHWTNPPFYDDRRDPAEDC